MFLFFQDTIDAEDTRKYANSKQGSPSTGATTDFFGIQYIAVPQNTALTARIFPFLVPQKPHQLQSEFDLRRQTIGEEPEDIVLVASGFLPQLVAQAKLEPPTPNWEKEIAEL
jgi:hypothetical protein